jgi:hypothetical protein
MGSMESVTQESELKQILTWEYFHKEEPDSEWTDSDFNGLGWMVMAWSLHLSQQSGRVKEGPGQGKAELLDLSEPTVHVRVCLQLFSFPIT